MIELFLEIFIIKDETLIYFDGGWRLEISIFFEKETCRVVVESTCILDYSARV